MKKSKILRPDQLGYAARIVGMIIDSTGTCTEDDFIKYTIQNDGLCENSARIIYVELYKIYKHEVRVAERKVLRMRAKKIQKLKSKIG